MCAIRLWLARKSEIPLREQLVSQLVLASPATSWLPAAAAQHARAGAAPARARQHRQRCLPRTGPPRLGGVPPRQRRLRPHARRQAGTGRDESLDYEIANLLRSVRERGTPLAAVRARIRHWLELQPPDRFLIIESDPELRRILAAELREAATLPVTDAGPEAVREGETLASAVVVFLASRGDRIRAALPPAAESLELDLRSVTGSLQLWTPIPRDALIAVASRWPDFLKWRARCCWPAGPREQE